MPPLPLPLDVPAPPLPLPLPLLPRASGADEPEEEEEEGDGLLDDAAGGGDAAGLFCPGAEAELPGELELDEPDDEVLLDGREAVLPLEPPDEDDEEPPEDALDEPFEDVLPDDEVLPDEEAGRLELLPPPAELEADPPDEDDTLDDGAVALLLGVEVAGSVRLGAMPAEPLPPERRALTRRLDAADERRALADRRRDEDGRVVPAAVALPATVGPSVGAPGATVEVSVTGAAPPVEAPLVVRVRELVAGSSGLTPGPFGDAAGTSMTVEEPPSNIGHRS